MNLLERLRSQFSYRCVERRILLNLAALRNGLAGLAACWILLVGLDQGWPAAIIVVCAPCTALFAGWLSADFLERILRMVAFGYVDNPNVSPRCELEGGNMPTSRAAEARWRATLFTNIHRDAGDDPGPGHYPLPIAGLVARFRALWTGGA